MIVRNKHKTANSFPSAPASSRYQLLLINFSSSFSAPLLTVGRGGKGNGGYDQSLTALLCHLLLMFLSFNTPVCHFFNNCSSIDFLLSSLL